MSPAGAWLWLWLAGSPTELSSEPQAIHGGAPANVCEFPTAVALYENGVLCSGTLVHPRLVLTAAHCIGDGPGPSVISFGEDIFAPARTVPVDHCLANPAATGSLGPWDFAYCLLAEDVLDVPPTPVLLGCETELLAYGQAVTIVGFGADDGDDSGRKHVGDTIVSSQTAGDVVLIGADGTAACSGDSGGPAYVQLGDGSWRAFGIVSGGVDCEAGVTYVTMHSMIGWVEQQTGMDFTPCHDADGGWNPGSACDGFSLEAHAPTTTWPSCDGARSGPSSTCGPAFGSEDDVEAPSVGFVEPLDGQVFAAVPSEVGVVIDAMDSGAGVEHVELWIAGQQVADDATAPWTFDGASFPAGEWMLEARAIDWRGNVGAAMVTILVGDAPDDTGDGETSDGDTGESETETGTPIDADPTGCSCGTTARPVGVAPWCLLWSLVWFGRRRRLAQGQQTSPSIAIGSPSAGLIVAIGRAPLGHI